MSEIAISMDEFIKNAANQFYNDEIMTYPMEQWTVKLPFKKEYDATEHIVSDLLLKAREYDKDLADELDDSIAAEQFEHGRNMFVMGALYAIKMASNNQ